MGDVDRIVGVDHQADEILLLTAVGIVELLIGIEIAKLARLDTDLHTAVHTVREHKLKRTAHIEEGRIVPAVGLTGNLRLDTPDDVIAARIAERNTARHQSGNDDLVVIVGRQANAGTGQLGGLQKEGIGRAVPHADRKRGLRQRDMHRRF